MTKVNAFLRGLLLVLILTPFVVVGGYFTTYGVLSYVDNECSLAGLSVSDCVRNLIGD